MGINYAKLRNLPAREIVAALTHDGFPLDRQVGSHRHDLHQDRRRVTVSFHQPGDTFRRKTLHAIIELQAGWTEEDLKRLKLVE